MSIAKDIIIVSGLRRSGTAMMMQILRAAGIELITDNRLEADKHNPNGYFEYEKAKYMRENFDWLWAAGGSAMKINAALLKELPIHFPYRIVFMQRDMDEIMMSQQSMIAHQPDVATEVDMVRQVNQMILGTIDGLVLKNPLMKVKDFKHRDFFERPDEVLPKLCKYLGIDGNIAEMKKVIDSELYKHRAK